MFGHGKIEVKLKSVQLWNYSNVNIEITNSISDNINMVCRKLLVTQLSRVFTISTIEYNYITELLDISSKSN